MKHLFWAVLFGSVTFVSSSGSTNTLPVRVRSTELETNKVAGQPVVRIKGISNGSFIGLGVTVEVDELGNVVSANASDDFVRYGMDPRPGLAAIKLWKFKPFLRNGVAVRVRSEARIQYLPEERWRNRNAVFPDVNFEDLQIKLQRTACYGSCPDYQVEIDGKGNVRFTTDPQFVSPDATAHRRFSGLNTLVSGQHEHRIEPNLVRDLVAKFREAAFFGLEDQYAYQVTDNPTYVLSFSTGGKSKSVIDYVGIQAGMPEIVQVIEKEIDRVADTGRWVFGNERTIAALESEGFDFGSKDASRMLLYSISESPEFVPLAMLEKGVSVADGNPVALSLALRAGKPKVFDRLLTLGGLASTTPTELDGLLFDAAQIRSPSLVKLLLEKGANSRAFVSGRGSPLVSALSDFYGSPLADEDQLGVVNLLLAAGSDLDARDGTGWSALQQAYDDDPKIVKLLLDKGANVNASGADKISYAERNDTLLFITDNEQTALIAIAAGARLDLTNLEGKKIRDIATENGWSEVLSLLAATSTPKR